MALVTPVESIQVDAVGTYSAPSPQQQVPTSPEPSHLVPTFPLLQSPVKEVDMDAESLALLESMILNGGSAPAVSDTAIPLALEQGTEQVVMDDILQNLNDSGLAELIANSELDASITDAALLSPVSYNDVESLLSSSPSSPEQTSFHESLNSSIDSAVVSDSSAVVMFNDSYFSDDASYLSESSAPSPAIRNKTNKRSTPYEKSGRRATNPDRKERKKEQNRSAALRYRQKKRDEKGGEEQKCQQLEARNKELREKVDSMTREINYLKDLMADVIKAKKGKSRGK